CSPPIKSVNSSFTIFTTCCAGDSDCNTSLFSARSLTRLTKFLTTLKFTSASNKAKRTSRIISFKSPSVILPFLPMFWTAPCSLSDKLSKAILGNTPYLFILSIQFGPVFVKILHLLHHGCRSQLIASYSPLVAYHLGIFLLHK